MCCHQRIPAGSGQHQITGIHVHVDFIFLNYNQIMTDNMNLVNDSILFLLKPKISICYLVERWTLRQALEKMRHYGYTALPVINEKGIYTGTVSEGDFLWHVLNKEDYSIYSQEKYRLADIIRPDFNPAVRVDAHIEDLVDRVMAQNFVPVIDDYGVLMGIITRQDVIAYLRKRK